MRSLELKYLRRRQVKKDRIAEIREVKDALVRQGDHPHVSPVVARWFRMQGLKCSQSLRQKGYWSVSVDD